MEDIAQCGAMRPVAPAAVLQVDLENCVLYVTDVSDLSKFATDPNITAVTPAAKNFGTTLLICDVVAVNGKPAKGTAIVNGRTANLSTNPGQAIADTVRTGPSNYAVEILQLDGTPVGSICVSGLSGGPAPPGAPLAVNSSNNPAVGGTGAFLGARGQLGGQIASPSPYRVASITEDPANRRRHGGGKFSMIVHLIPLSRPEVVVTPDGPAVVHSSDFSLVSAAKPAQPGETLSLIATGLGPTRPGLDPGKPFPASPLSVVNSPVEVTLTWETRRGTWRCRLTRLRGPLPDQRSGSCRHAARRRNAPVERSLDCRR